MFWLIGAFLNMLAMPAMVLVGILGIVTGMVFAINEKWDLLFSYRYFFIWWCVFCCFIYRRAYAWIMKTVRKANGGLEGAIDARCHGFFDRHFGPTCRKADFFDDLYIGFVFAVYGASLILACYLVFLYFRGGSWAQLVGDKRFKISLLVVYPALLAAPYVVKVLMIFLFRLWAVFADRVFGVKQDVAEEFEELKR